MLLIHYKMLYNGIRIYHYKHLKHKIVNHLQLVINNNYNQLIFNRVFSQLNYHLDKLVFLILNKIHYMKIIN
jgi:hypothetical protein